MGFYAQTVLEGTGQNSSGRCRLRSIQSNDENIERMASGKAPIGWDGCSVTLHHWKGIANDFYDFSPVTRTFHIYIHKYGGLIK